MKWRKKKNPISTTNKEEQEQEEEVVVEVVVGNDEPNTINKPSSFSKNINLSKILPFSSWLSKLKPKRSTTAPITPKPLFSPRPLPNCTQPAEAIPRRLSVGDEDTHLTRSRASHSLLPRRHNSFGSEIELRSDLHLLDLPRTTPRRRRRKPRPAPDPPRSGRRSSAGGRIRPKVRVCSPRLANPNPNPMGRLESYAVVKRSRDPARDFRESMVEMIREKGIGRSDELESLLACYLSLNLDEHHDVIVKVFRQVWFDFNRRMDPGF